MEHDSRSEKKGWRRFSRLRVEKGTIKRRARKIESATLKHAHRFLVRRWMNVRDVGRFTLGWLFLVGLLIGLAFVQSVWFADAYTTTAPAQGGTYAEGIVGQMETMNPLFASTPAEVSASKLVFSSLLHYDRDDKLRPDCAESWSVSEDGKVYTVNLRSNIPWHDGTPLTADDVVFTVRLIQDPSVKAMQYGSLAGVKVEKKTDKQVVFTLPSAYAPFAHALTFGILPKHILKDIKPTELRENTFGRNPVGTGPFSFRKIQLIDPEKNRLVVHLEVNERYFQQVVRLNRFQIHTYENRDALKRALITSEVNGALGLGADQINDLTKRHEFSAASSKIADGVFAIFNNDQANLKDIRVRQALLLATNRQKIIASVYHRGAMLEGPFSEGLVSGVVASQASFNLQAAGQKLDEAGWKLSGTERKKDDGTKLELSVVAPNSGDYPLIMQELVREWKQLGVSVKTQLVDSDVMASEYLQARNYDVLVYELAIGADPDVYPYWHSSQAHAKGLNFANYRSGLADDLLSSGRSKNDMALRSAKYKNFAEQWVKDTPAIALYQPFLNYVTADATTSLDTGRPIVDAVGRYRNIEQWSASKMTVMTTP